MKKIFLALPFLLFYALVFSQDQNAFTYNIQKEIQCNRGAVVSAHPLASMAGLQMLQQGGNAVDAAIATQLALAVVYPGAGNIGGGGFMVAHLADGRDFTLDYRETAPAKASRDMYLDKVGNPIMEMSQTSPSSSGVPGTIAGLFASLSYAKLPFAKLIAPAIQLAEKGFALSESQAKDFNSYKETFQRFNKHKIAFVKDTPWQAGDTLIQKDLAATLKRIATLGQKGFYEGVTAKMIVAEMQKGKGYVSLQDLADYKTVWRQPIKFDYKGYEVVSMPLPSSGGILLQQMLGMIGDRKIEAMGFHSPQSIQLMIEAERRAYADRAEYMGDEDFVKVPVSTLVSKAYLQNRMADYDPTKAGSSDATKAGMIGKESTETTHLSVIDKEGNAVSVTTTLNGHFGSLTVVEGAGFLLNNEMDDFSVKPGTPNMYGAVGNEQNAISPGKRMLSSMTPTLLLKDKKAFMVVGSPGGTTIPTSVFQSIVNVVDFNLSPSDAVNLPKFHHQWLPDEVMIEKGISPEVISDLEKMGYKIKMRGAIGRTEMILVLPNKTKFQTIIAVADKRGDDSAAGW